MKYVTIRLLVDDHRAEKLRARLETTARGDGYVGVQVEQEALHGYEIEDSPAPTFAEAIDSLPRTDVECRVWLRDHRLANNVGIGAVFSAVRADLRKIAGGEGRG